MKIKKISSFVGILLVGFMVFSLVAGAGYNIVVPAVVTDDSSSSSGGGGGSFYVTTNTTDNESGSDVGSGGTVNNGSSGDTTSDGDSGIGRFDELISRGKEFWVWFVIGGAILSIGVVIYFKKFRK